MMIYLENYKPILHELINSKPIMICSNPDKTVVRGDKFMICAGLLAENTMKQLVVK